MLSDSDKAVVDLPKVMGRELVCRDSLGRPWGFKFGPGIEGETRESMVEEEFEVGGWVVPGSEIGSHTWEGLFEVEGSDCC